MKDWRGVIGRARLSQWGAAVAGVLALALASSCGCAARPQAAPAGPVWAPMRTTLAGPLIEVELKAGQVRRGWMLLDTGDSGGFTLVDTPAHVAAMPAAFTGDRHAWSFGVADVKPVRVDWAVIAGRTLRPPAISASAMAAADLSSNGDRVGVAVLQQWACVDINFDWGEVDFYSQPPPPPQSPRAVRLPIQDRPGRWQGREPLVEVLVNGTPCLALLDTGFSGLIGGRESLLTALGADAAAGKERPVNTAIGTTPMRSLPFRGTLGLGGRAFTIEGNAAAFEDAPKEHLGEHQVILGMEFLRRLGRVRFDWSGHEVVLFD